VDKEEVITIGHTHSKAYHVYYNFGLCHILSVSVTSMLTIGRPLQTGFMQF